MEILRLLNDFIGPILSLVIGGLFAVWQLQLKNKRDLMRQEAENRERLEKKSREERERLEQALERERAERKEEMKDTVHHLKTKMQIYENELAASKTQRSLSEQNLRLMEEALTNLRKTNQQLEEENQVLRRRLSHLEPLQHRAPNGYGEG